MLPCCQLHASPRRVREAKGALEQQAALRRELSANRSVLAADLGTCNRLSGWKLARHASLVRCSAGSALHCRHTTPALLHQPSLHSPPGPFASMGSPFAQQQARAALPLGRASAWAILTAPGTQLCWRVSTQSSDLGACHRFEVRRAERDRAEAEAAAAEAERQAADMAFHLLAGAATLLRLRAVVLADRARREVGFISRFGV